MLKNNLPVIALVVAFGAALFFWLRTNSKKIINMAEYRLTGITIGRVNPLNTTIKASILIINPSELALRINQYRVEIYRLNEGARRLLAQTPVTSLDIPASASIVNNVQFVVSNIELLGLIMGTIRTGVESQLKGNIIIVIKADVLGHYVEKELKY